MDLQVKINALVTPLEKPSPRGDTGNEPVFCLRFLKEVEPVSSGQRKPQAEGRYLVREKSGEIGEPEGYLGKS